MKLTIAKTQWTVIALLLAVILLQRQCHRCPDCPEPETKVVEVWKYDTTNYLKWVPVPVPYETIVHVPVMVPAEVDTEAIVRDYYSAYIYNRVLMDDSLAFISLEDTVFNNRLMSATLHYTDRTPTQIIYNTFTETNNRPVNKIFAGFALDNRMDVGASVLLLTKRDHAYAITADPFEKRYTGAAYWKISLRKKKR